MKKAASFVVFMVATSAFAESSLDLAAYLREVRDHHAGVQGSLANSEGAQDLAVMGTLLLAPTLFVSAQAVKDKRITLVPDFMGTETDTNTYSLGVSKLTSFGLLAKLSYNIDYNEVIGASPVFLPVSSYHDAYPKIELTQSLWKNFLGHETQANQSLLEAQRLTTTYSESYRTKTLLADAEITYWSLALQRDTVAVQRASLSRAAKLRDWNARRVRLHLADRADLLQAEAALKSRELELQAAVDDERTASRSFNSVRGEDSDLVPEKLVDLDMSALDATKVNIVRETLRDDVKAAQQQERVEDATAETNLQELSPDLQLYGNYSYNGRDAGLSQTMTDSFHTDHPMWTVGVRLIAPLDLPAILQSRNGAKLQRFGAEKNYERKLFEQEEDWKELNLKLEESRRRLDLARMIEAAQKEKLLFEKDRLSRGRTTTYQVLLFEQDYANAQLKRIQTQTEVFRILAQLKTFRGTI